MEILKYWTPEEFEYSSFSFGINTRINSTYTTSGSDNTKMCEYNYNELGFRGDSVNKEGFKVMSIGCSFTEGVGVNDNETWPAQFVNFIPNGVNMNFGTGGRSNDFMSRCLLTYYDVIKPDLVLIMYTSTHRREIYTPEGNIEPYMPTAAWGYMEKTKEGRKRQEFMNQIQNEHEDFNNWYRNHQLIKLFLETKKCNWLWNGSMVDYDYNDSLRFDGDFTPFTDLGIDGGHPGPKTNYLYGKQLFEYIKNNFPNYLPETPPMTSKLL